MWKKGGGKKNQLAHREDRTRSLQMPSLDFRLKSLTLYPIELGGQYQFLLGKQLTLLNTCPSKVYNNIIMKQQNIPIP